MARQISAQNLICPLDQKALQQEGNSLRCETGHSFDIAKQGYVNLLPVQKKRSKDPGDSKEMIVARQQFLNAGLYQPVSGQLNQLVHQYLTDDDACILDAGCGEGYYLDQLAQSFRPAESTEDASAGEASKSHPALIGLDISKWAVQAAAKRNKALTWLVGTNAQLPVQPASLDMIICMFGFYDTERMAGCLKSGGLLMLAEAGSEHLIELRELIYPEVRRTPLPDLSAALEQGYQLIDETRLTFKPETLNAGQIQDLLVMTPHLYRASFEGKQKARALTRLEITVDVVFRVLQKQ